jgi:formylmethanofuran dehydrogenase subunit E
MSEGDPMTFMTIEDTLTDEEEVAQSNNQTVKCSWCGEIIRLDGKELALAMCQACYEQMLSEFLRSQKLKRPDIHASDR